MLWITGDLSRLVQESIDAAPTATLVTDVRGEILYVNRGLEHQFGYHHIELIGHNIERLVPGAMQAAYARLDGAARAGEDAPPRALHACRKDGAALAIEFSWNAITMRGESLVLASLIDAEQRRTLEGHRRVVIERQLEFEQLIGRLAIEFIELPDIGVENIIRSGLQRISSLVAADVARSALFAIDGEGAITDACDWTAAGTAAMPWPALPRWPWVLARIAAGQLIAFSSLSDIPSQIDRETLEERHLRSGVFIPLHLDDRVAGAVAFCTIEHEREWPLDLIGRLYLAAGALSPALRRARPGAATSAAIATRPQESGLAVARDARQDANGASRMVAPRSGARLLEQIQQVAPTDSTVLLLGETGTGKELLATQIHQLSPRRGRPMIRVNCAAIPATLIESELFGREKGAFTGALAKQAGRFEMADHSTIFLDEIGDLPPEVQVKLLRVVEERQIERLGSPRSIVIDTRIIAATHRDLEALVKEGKFREDLYYRLNVFPIRVPTLRERVEDIPRLVWNFVEEFSRVFGKRIDVIDKDSMEALQRYSWPGNIRELRNAVERAMIVNTGTRLVIALHPTITPAAPSPKLVDVEREHIRAVLESTGWRIRGAGGAAERLGLKPTTLDTRMAKFGLKRPGHR